MAFRTITARFAGVCVRCKKAGIRDGREKIAAGTSIRFGGRGQTYHLSKQCPASNSEPVGATSRYSRPVEGDCNEALDPVGHAPDLDNFLEGEGSAWTRRAEEGWGPGGY